MTFLDTSAWLAALSAREARHASATRRYREWVTGGEPLVTTNLVMAEMQILISRSRGADAGVRFLDRVYADRAHEVVFVDRVLERAAVDRWLRKFVDHNLSLADAVSFEVMRARRIGRAFTFDRHFEHAGFEVVP